MPKDEYALSYVYASASRNSMKQIRFFSVYQLFVCSQRKQVKFILVLMLLFCQSVESRMQIGPKRVVLQLQANIKLIFLAVCSSLCEFYMNT